MLEVLVLRCLEFLCFQFSPGFVDSLVYYTVLLLLF